MPVALYLAPCLDSFADEVLVPWFAEANRVSWAAAEPAVVMVPGLVHGHRIRHLLAKRGIPSLNIHFWTPTQVRVFLSRATSSSAPWEDRVDRVAILRSAAETVGATDPANRSATALGLAPDSLSDTLDLIEAGGWASDVIGVPALRQVFSEREKFNSSSGREGPAAFAFGIKAGKVEGCIARLLIAGFDAAHWADWSTLHIAALAAREATVLLRTPRQKAEGIELTWLASWEALGGEVKPVEAEGPGGAPDVAAAFDEIPFERQGATFRSDGIEFALADSVVAEASEAAGFVARALARGAEQISVVVPGAGYLSCEVIRCLDALGLPYYNGLPARRSESVRADFWRKLLSCLEKKTIGAFQAVSSESVLDRVRPVPREQLRRILERETAALTFSDLGIAAAFLNESEREEVRSVGAFMEHFCTWPARGTIDRFLTLLGALCERLCPPAFAADVRQLRVERADLLPLMLSGAGVRQWIEERLTATEPVRSDTGANPYARIQLLRPSDATGLAWDSVVFVGQNEGEWPPQARACPFLGDDALRLLNEQVIDLNRSAKAAKSMSDDVAGVKPGRALCLSPALARSLALRDFADFIEQSGGLAVTAALRDPARPGSTRGPGELFARLFQLLHRRPVARASASDLLPALRIAPSLLYPEPASDGVDEMLRACRARQEPSEPFGVFEFCLGARPDWAVRIPASAWAVVNERPATVFMHCFLGVQAPRIVQGELPWALISGIWVHDWISKAVGPGPVRVGDVGNWRDAILRQGHAYRQRIEAILGARGRRLPAWWGSLFEQSARLAVQFARSLGEVGGYEYVQAEADLPLATVELHCGARLPVHGRVDMLFMDKLPFRQTDFKGVKVAIYDFKTGQDRPLTVERIKNGIGVQLPIYALGYHAHGAVDATMTLLKAGQSAAPQLRHADLASASEVWERFAWMLETGAFGRLEAMRPEFGGGRDFPIACLETHCNLKAKLALTQAAAALSPA